MTQVDQAKGSIPVCAGCGRYTCPECGRGFQGQGEYLRHRLDRRAHAPLERADERA